MCINKTGVKTRVNLLPRVFDPLHFINFFRFFHELLFSDMDSAFRTLEVEGIIDISTNTLFTTIRIWTDVKDNNTSNVHKELAKTWYSPVRRYSCYYNYHIQFQIAWWKQEYWRWDLSTENWGNRIPDVLQHINIMNATAVAKLKFILPSLRKLNERALSLELDKLSVKNSFIYSVNRKELIWWISIGISYIFLFGEVSCRIKLWISSGKVFYFLGLLDLGRGLIQEFSPHCWW